MCFGGLRLGSGAPACRCLLVVMKGVLACLNPRGAEVLNQLELQVCVGGGVYLGITVGMKGM